MAACTASAPNFSARARRSGSRSTAKTRLAPRAKASCNADIPKPPTPNTATLSPGARRAFFNACSEVDDEHISTAAHVIGTASGTRKALRSGTQTYSP